MIVVDASAVIGLLAEEPGNDRISSILGEQRELMAPAVIDVEVTNYLKTMERRGEVDSSRTVALLDDFVDLVGELAPLRPLLPTAWRLRHNLSIPDAFYVALAAVYSVPLLTRDRRLAAAAGDAIEVILV